MSLNEEDKQWIRNELASLRTGFETKIEPLAISLRTDLQNQLQHLETSFETQMRHLEISLRTEFATKLEHLETTLLTEFHKWASPQDARMRTHAATLRALDLEMEALRIG